MRRRPLLRAAAVGGGAYYMGKRRAEAQEQEASQYQPTGAPQSQEQPAAEAPQSGGISSASVERLEQLGRLHEQGVLTDEEFSQQKERVLSG